MKLDEWYGFDLGRGLSRADLDFSRKMLMRRHLLVHNEGRVDGKYLKETGDTFFQLNETIAITKTELDRLIPIVRKLASHLIADVEELEVVF